MEIITKLRPLLLSITIIAGIFSAIRCFFEKKNEQIPIILIFTCVLLGLIMQPQIMPKLGEKMIIYFCDILEIKGVV